MHCQKMNLKRTNWTNEEVAKLLKGRLATNGKGEPWIEGQDEIVADLIDLFSDFMRPETESGALALDTDTGLIVHVGPILPKQIK